MTIDILNLLKAQNTDTSIPQYEGEVSVKRAFDIINRLDTTELEEDYGDGDRVRYIVKAFVTRIINKDHPLNTINEESKDEVYNNMRNALGWLFDVAERNPEKGVLIMSQIVYTIRLCATAYSNILSTLHAQYCLDKFEYVENTIKFINIIELLIHNYKLSLMHHTLASFIEEVAAKNERDIQRGKPTIAQGDKIHLKNYYYQMMIKDGWMSPTGLDEVQEDSFLLGGFDRFYDKFLTDWKNDFNLEGFCISLKESLLQQKNFWIYLTDTVISKKIANPEDILENLETYEGLKNSIILLLLHELGYVKISEKYLPNGKLTIEDINRLDELLLSYKEKDSLLKELNVKHLLIGLGIGLGIGVIAGGVAFGIMCAYSTTSLQTFCGLDTSLAAPVFGLIIMISTAALGTLIAASYDLYPEVKSRLSHGE